VLLPFWRVGREEVTLALVLEVSLHELRQGATVRILVALHLLTLLLRGDLKSFEVPLLHSY